MNSDQPPEDTGPLLAQSRVELVSAALVECQANLKAAEFDSQNPFFKAKYASLGSVIASSRVALGQAGLAILQIPSIQGDLVSVHTRIVHSSGQSLDCGVMSLSMGESDRNSDAQLAGSILTYLKRYAWASVLGIYADADDDGNSGPKGAVPRQNAPGRAATPKPPSESTQAKQTALNPPSEAPKTTTATIQQRMKALNQLKAAPGQDNRGLLDHFLRVKGWITVDQTPEDWHLGYVPTTQKQFLALAEEVEAFARQQAELELQEEGGTQQTPNGLEAVKSDQNSPKSIK